LEKSSSNLCRRKQAFEKVRQGRMRFAVSAVRTLQKL